MVVDLDSFSGYFPQVVEFDKSRANRHSRNHHVVAIDHFLRGDCQRLADNTDTESAIVFNYSCPTGGDPVVVARSLTPTHAKGVPFCSNVLFIHCDSDAPQLS